MSEETFERLVIERNGYRWHLHECEQIAGKALGYPWYKDDQKNFPGTTEEDGVCIGEHVGDTIVAELARRYGEMKEKLADPYKLASLLVDSLRSAADENNDFFASSYISPETGFDGVTIDGHYNLLRTAEILKEKLSEKK